MKKSKHILKTTLILALGIIFLNSCSSDSDDGPEPENNKKSSYSFTFQDGQKHANSWDAEDQGRDITSFHSVPQSNEYETVTLTLGDVENNNIVQVSLSLDPATQQPFPLRHPSQSDGWNQESDYSWFQISIGDIDYSAYSGTAKLSNLKKETIHGIGGNAYYDLELDGMFYKFDELEQVKITGTVSIASKK